MVKIGGVEHLELMGAVAKPHRQAPRPNQRVLLALSASQARLGGKSS